MTGHTETPTILAESPSKRRWRIVFLLLCIAAILLLHGMTYRHLLPNQWRGEVAFPFEWWQPVGLLSALGIASYLLMGLKKWVWTILFWMLACAPCFFPLRLGPEFRFRCERVRYLEAARSGARYGDQHEEIVGGRKLIYWRWMSWGIDNSIGVIYDPKDRFIQGSLDDLDRQSQDFMAFRRIARGHLASSRRMGGGLYLVTHT